VRALIEAHRAPEAYAAAGEAIRRAPQSAEAQTAFGLAMFRRGEMAKADVAFHEALRIDSKYAGALSGMAAIYRLTSKFQIARQYLNMAWHFPPDDPDLIVAHANTLRGAAHNAALKAVLAVYDPSSREARSLRAHIAADEALGDRKLRRLATPYQHYSLKLAHIGPTPSHSIGVGLHAGFNGGPTVRLLLDTGASGIAISTKAAEKTGLERLGDESSEVHGIGDREPQDSYRYLAREIGIGDLAFADYPVSVFDSAKDPNYDGLIGADVFRRFLVSIDFAKFELTLDPFVQPPDEDEGLPDAAPLQPGFVRAFRLGNHLTLPTQVNGSGSRLFLIGFRGERAPGRCQPPRGATLRLHPHVGVAREPGAGNVAPSAF
jgi:hypothetical protein